MKRFVAALTSSLVVCCSMGFFSSLPVSAMQSSVSTAGIVADAKSDACAGIGLTGADCSGGTGQSQVQTLLNTGINLFSVIVGVAAVIMIIVAGMKYTLSGGDTTKTNSAKSTIIYALVGIAVVALSQLLVRIVLTNAK